MELFDKVRPTVASFETTMEELLPWILIFEDDLDETTIWVVVIACVGLALAQIIIFNLNKKTRYGLNIHTAIAYLGMGAAFYAVFYGALTLKLIVIGMVLIGSGLIKLRRNKSAPQQRRPVKSKQVPESKIVAAEPDETKAWCQKCLAHTRLNKNRHCCEHCRGPVIIPSQIRRASNLCCGCAAVPQLITLWVLLATFRSSPQTWIGVGALMFVVVVLIGFFPAYFVCQYWGWLKWARQTQAKLGE
ncbi:MAG: hypothetical protein QF363_15635 [Planctomycetaceae bacterium]|jgi:hypothetical protein|nr:hypothetical protein [Planctomycetaceae bacterium]